MGHEDRDWYREDRARRDKLRVKDSSGGRYPSSRPRGWLRRYLVEALQLLAFIGAVWWLFQRFGGAGS